ncbi:MAG: hypothetical protein HY231_09155 [Acidobacteria bacterium]|nr:hypothetical protein [Acidobacteriota bacterium]
MLLKFLLFSVIAYVVIRFVRGLMIGLNGQPKVAKAGAGQTPRQRPQRASAALMIRCAACGTFITESSAVLSGSHVFCSDSCAKIPMQRT